MNKCIYSGVNIFNPLEGNMKYFIDAFTKVYGEKYRTTIEKRLTSANYFFHGNDLHAIIEKYKQKKQEELSRLDSYSITPNLKQLKSQQINERYNHIINIFSDCINKQNEINLRYSKLRQKYLIQNINLIRKNNGLNELSFAELSQYNDMFFNLLVLGKDKLTKNSLLLSDNKKKQYTSLFNILGFKAENFNEFLKNKKILNSVFNPYVINQLNSWNASQKRELFNSNFFSVDIKDELRKLKIINNSGYLNLANEYINGYTHDSAFVVSCLTEDYKFKRLCFCNNALTLNLQDLIHEMGHIIDSFITESDVYGYYFKCGFELFYEELQYNPKRKICLPEPTSKIYRQSKLFNEMVNEYICLQVAKLVEKCGKTIVFGKRQNRMSYYEFGFEIFEPFLKKYQNKLIDLKLQIDKNDNAYKFFGEKNFNNLTLIAKEYIEKRCALNAQSLQGKNVYDEINELKSSSRKKLAKVERQIENHIELQKLSSQELCR